jgi:hypothetical protein
MHAARPMLPFAAFLFLTLPGLAQAVTIDWVTVGDPDNVADDTGYGAVADVYGIGKHLVTIQQYTDFLNAVAQSDPYSLYDPSMATDLNIAGIARSGTSGGYSYSVINCGGPSGNRPITYVSWFDGAGWNRLCGLGSLSASQAGLTRGSQPDSSARGAGQTGSGRNREEREAAGRGAVC